MNTPDLIKENEELKRDIAAKSDLISVSAHQLRTSLSAIKWIMKMFIDGDFGALTPEQMNFMNKAYESDERMIHLVNEMLSINHAEDMLENLHLEPINIVDIVDDVVFDFASESYKRGIEMIFLKPTQSVKLISADAEKVRVIIQNLIENSIKYSNQGGKVFINVAETPDGVEISVRDTGIGIETADQPRIFNKNFRAVNAEKKDKIGSGLGLFTTKRMVEKHAGKIWFESTPGEGSTFHVLLPHVN